MEETDQSNSYNGGLSSREIANKIKESERTVGFRHSEAGEALTGRGLTDKTRQLTQMMSSSELAACVTVSLQDKDSGMEFEE